MTKRFWWAISLSVLGLCMYQKQTYWLASSYLRDLRLSISGLLGGALVGYLIGTIVEKTKDQHQRRVKVAYWVVVLFIFGCFLGTGNGVGLTTTISVVGVCAAIGLAVGLLQYFFQPGSAN